MNEATIERVVQEYGKQVEIVTFGFRYGTPPPAETIFSVMHINDLSIREVLNNKPNLYDFVMQQPTTKATCGLIVEYIELVTGRMPTVFGIGCKSGRLRSVVIGEIVAQTLKDKGFACRLFHRDRLRGSFAYDDVTCVPTTLGVDLAWR